jgi:hypothetical protein
MTQGGHGVTTDKIVSAARPHKSTIRLVEQRAGIITPFKGAHALRHYVASRTMSRAFSSGLVFSANLFSP